MFFLQIFILLAWVYTELHLQYGPACPSSLRSFEQGGWLLSIFFFNISTTSFPISACQPITQHTGAHRENVVNFQVALDYLQGGVENTRDREQRGQKYGREDTQLYMRENFFSVSIHRIYFLIIQKMLEYFSSMSSQNEKYKLSLARYFKSFLN